MVTTSPVPKTCEAPVETCTVCHSEEDDYAVEKVHEVANPYKPPYLREPRRGFFSSDWRTLIFFRLGLLITNVPLPRYSALNSLSSAKKVLL